MRSYNYDFVNLHYSLIKIFLVKMDKNILDISYGVDSKKITIQIVFLKGYTLSQERIASVKESLVGFDVVVIELYLTKEQFNNIEGEWLPQYYKWLKYLLFSRAKEL